MELGTPSRSANRASRIICGLPTTLTAYEALTPDEALFWEHRGVWAPYNLPRHVESWENVFWPRHPNARRQAYIEVLTEKLDRARET